MPSLKPRAPDDPHVKSLDDKLKNHRGVVKKAVDAACKRAKVVSEEAEKKQEKIEAAAKKEAESKGQVYDGTHRGEVRKQWKVNSKIHYVGFGAFQFDEHGNPTRIDRVEKERRLRGVEVLIQDLGKKPRHLTEGEILVLAERESYRAVGHVNYPFRFYLNFEQAQRAAKGEEDAKGEEITKKMLENANAYGATNKDYLNAVSKFLTKISTEDQGLQRGSVRGAKVEGGKRYCLQTSLRNSGYCFLPDGRVVCRDNHLHDVLDVTEESGQQYSRQWNRWTAYQNSKKYRTDNEASAESVRLFSGLSIAEIIFQDDEGDYAEFASSSLN